MPPVERRRDMNIQFTRIPLQRRAVEHQSGVFCPLVGIMGPRQRVDGEVIERLFAVLAFITLAATVFSVIDDILSFTVWTM